ncbi:MAG TPA: glycosyltransferase family 39 protein [Chthoniobacterales bacterium]|nr:glycosyltransferase family 39 protein [Chthoniobacterales bacterium]
MEEDNCFGAFYTQAARNNLRAGLGTTGGVPATLYFGPLPIPRDAYYVHHPILVPLMVTGSVAIFGEKEWAVKLVPIFCSLASAAFLWFLVRDTIGRRPAALVAAFFATLPMELHYGDMVDFEPCLVMWMLAALVCLRLWETRQQRHWAILTALCCFCAVWTDWPGYLFVLSVSVSFLLRKKGRRPGFAFALAALAAVSGILFLLDIRHANPEAWRDLWTAITMRLGNGVAPGSSAAGQIPKLHFTFPEWMHQIFHGLGQDYLVWSWLLVLAGLIYLIGKRQSPGFRWLGWAALQMMIAGIPYMLLLRNWSFIHDFASFFVIGSIAILGGLGIEAGLVWWESQQPLKLPRPVGAIVAVALLFWLAVAGFRRAENLRSQLLMLDGTTAEPKTLIPDLGRYLAKTFPAETTILSNFDPYYSPLDYYAHTTIVRNIGTNDEWNSAAAAAGPRVGGIVWLAAPPAPEILGVLPKGETTQIEIDGVRFALWKPANEIKPRR